ARTWSWRIRSSQGPAVETGIERAAAPHPLEVRERPARSDQRRKLLVAEVAIGTVGNCADHQVVSPAVGLGDLEPVFALDLLGRSDRVRDLHLVAEPLQPAN